MDKYDEFYLQNLCVYEIRKIAREHNIKAPTSRSKGDNIRLIKLAMDGNLPKEYHKGDYDIKGRPSRSNFSINEDEYDLVTLEMLDDLNSILRTAGLLKKRFMRNAKKK